MNSQHLFKNSLSILMIFIVTTFCSAAFSQPADVTLNDSPNVSQNVSQAAAAISQESAPVSLPANPQKNPPTKSSAQQTATGETAQLLQWLGVLPALRQVPQVIELSARGQLMNLPSSEAVQNSQAALQQQINIDSLQVAVVDYVAARVDARILARAKSLLEQSVPAALRQADSIMQTSSAVADMNEFQRKMTMQPVVSTRSDLAIDINRVMRTSVIAVQIQTSVDQMVNHYLARDNIVAMAPENLISQKLAARQAFMQKRVVDMTLFTYKDVRATELREFVVLMSDDSIQKLLDLSQQGIEMALRENTP